MMAVFYHKIKDEKTGLTNIRPLSYRSKNGIHNYFIVFWTKY
jgi:hypothetical protein